MMRVGIIYIFAVWRLAQGQEDRLYLPPKDFQGPPPPSVTFNFLDLPDTSSSVNSKLILAKEHVTVSGNCNPPPLDQLVLHSSWHPIKRGDTLYPILADGNRDEREQFGGRGACAHATEKEECITFQWNSAGNEVSISSFDGCKLNKRVSKCAQLDRERFLVRCTFENNVTITQNIVKTDSQIWMLGYECYTNADGSPGPVTWSVYSVYKAIPTSLRKEILGYVRDFGFDTLSYRETRYDNCPPIPEAYPELRSYPETQVENLRPAPKICNPPSNTLEITNWNPEKRDDVLYLPLVFAKSDPTIRSGYIDDRNSGSCPVNGESKKRRKQCLGLKFDTGLFKTEFQYHDGCEHKVLNADCVQLQYGKLATLCKQDDGIELRQYAVSGDNHTYLLMYECWNRSEKPVSWSLRSVSQVIPESLKRLILSHVETLGFDSRDYRETNYTNCPIFY